MIELKNYTIQELSAILGSKGKSPLCGSSKDMELNTPPPAEVMVLCLK